MVNAISVDLEDWYHICGVNDPSAQDEWKKYSIRLEHSVEKILHLFKQHNVRATFFTVGIIADNAPSLIKKIADAGHEVASHGYAHRRIFDMNPDEFEKDLVQSKIAIEKAAGRKILGYRAPEWSLKKSNIWALEILRKHGFAYDASAVPLTHLGGKYFGLYPYEIKTQYGNIIEFPLSTFRCFWERLPFSGGLPMRINPYCYILDNTRKLNNMGYSVIFYLHPWEFDAEHEKIDLPFNRKFMHYCNIKSTEKKISLLLERFQFSAVENVLGLKMNNTSNHSLPTRHGQYYDTHYFTSLLSGYSLVLSIFLTICIAAFLMGKYAVLIVIILATIFYWPWGILFNKLNVLFPKKIS